MPFICCKQYCLPYAHISPLVLSMLGSSSLCSFATASRSFILSLHSCLYGQGYTVTASQAAPSPMATLPTFPWPVAPRQLHTSSTHRQHSDTVTILYLCLTFFACVGGRWGWRRDRSASTVNSGWDPQSND